MPIWVGLLIALALAAAAAAVYGMRSARRGGGRKVEKLADYRKKTVCCSHCSRKSERVAFYADPGGKVVGLCRECKAKAERQGFMPM